MDYEPETEEEGSGEFEDYAIRSGAIFLIDCSEKVFEDEAEMFGEAMKIVLSMLMNSVIANQKDQMGIVLYNVERTHAPVEEKEDPDEVEGNVAQNVSVFMRLKKTNAHMVKFIYGFNESADFHNFAGKYGHNDSNPRCLVEALSLCSKMFQSASPKLQEKVVYLLTANPTPFQHGSDEEKAAFKKATDMQESEIDLTLVPLANEFDLGPFYSSFCAIATHDELEWNEEVTPEVIREKLKGRNFCPNFRRRTLGSVKLQLGDGLEISVSIFPTSRTLKPPQKSILQKDTNEEISKKIVHFVEVRAEEEPDEEHDGSGLVKKHVHSSDLIKFVSRGDRSIEFSRHEHSQILRLMPPIIKILGFQPSESLKPHLHCRKPLFLYPNESWIAGSAPVFTALWYQCMAKDKIAYAIMQQQSNSRPKLVALVPQSEFAVGSFARSAGFRVEFVPHREWLRDLSFLSDLEVVASPEEELAVMKKLVKSLKMKFNPSDFLNPSINLKYARCEETLLDLEPEKIDDFTVPDLELQDARMKDFLDNLTAVFGEDVAVAEKRKAKNSAVGAPRPKVPKANAPINVVEAFNEHRLDKCSVDQLKAFLQANGEQGLSKLKKADLLARVEEAIERLNLSNV